MSWPTECGSIAAIASSPAPAAAVLPIPAILPIVPTAAFPARCDGVRIYGSGAASDGGAQASEAANLGNFRSSSELASLAVFGAMERLTINRAGEIQDAGIGVLVSDGIGRVRWTAPGSTVPGPWVSIGNGQTALLEDGVNPDRALRVTLNGAIPAASSRQIKLLEQYNNPFGSRNITDAEHTSGISIYRAVFLKNNFLSPVDLRIYLNAIASAQTLSATYAASGAVTLQTSATFDGWPDSGFAGNTRTNEVLYYTSRTATALTVPAAGRDMFSDGTAAGAIGDQLYPMSGIRLASELPATNPGGSIQTIASETTAPTGRTWAHPLGETGNNVVVVRNLASGNQVGLWIHRLIPAAAVARALVFNDIVVDHFLLSN